MAEEFSNSLLGQPGVQTDGHRVRIPRRLLDRSDESEASVFSAPADVGSPYSDFTDPAPASSGSISLPARLESSETLEFLGFRPEIAASMWQVWSGFSAEDRDWAGDFLDWAIAAVDDYWSPACGAPEDDWSRAIRTIGMTESMENAIMDPQYADIRCTATAQHWIRESIKDRRDFLKGTMQRSFNQDQHFTFESGSGRIFPTGSINGPPGCIVLWRGTIMERVVVNPITAIWPSGQIGEGDISLFGTYGSPPTDFSGRQLRAYWSTQRETAQKYAEFCRRRLAGIPASPVLIRLEIPNHIFEAVPLARLEFPSPDFKETVWTCRRGQHFPARLSYVKQAMVIMGDTLTSVNGTYAQMPHFNAIDERYLFMVEVDGVQVKAQQTALKSDDDFVANMERVCKERITLRHFRHPERIIENH